MLRLYNLILLYIILFLNNMTNKYNNINKVLFKNIYYYFYNLKIILLTSYNCGDKIINFIFF